MLNLYYNNTQRICLMCVLFFLVAVTIIPCYSRVPKPSFEKVTAHACIQIKGTIVYPDIPPPSSGLNPIGWLIEISRIVTALLGILALASAIVDLIKRYLWRKKYGKSRTPIMMPMRSMRAQCVFSRMKGQGRLVVSILLC